MRSVEQPFCRELGLELFKRQREVARALRHHAVGIELVNAVALIDGNIARHDDLHAVFRTKAQVLCAAAEHHALDARIGILEREIAVSRGIAFEIRQFAADAQMRERGLTLKHPLDVIRDITDTVNGILRFTKDFHDSSFPSFQPFRLFTPLQEKSQTKVWLLAFVTARFS